MVGRERGGSEGKVRNVERGRHMQGHKRDKVRVGRVNSGRVCSARREIQTMICLCDLVGFC